MTVCSSFIQNFSIKNIKAHFTLPNSELLLLQLVNRSSSRIGIILHNFFVFRKDSFVYIIFPSPGHINVSGIKKETELNLAKEVFCDEIGYKSEISNSSLIIDNITAVCSICSTHPINLPKLKEVVERRANEKEAVSLRTYTFPAAVWRRGQKPTIQIFSTGKVVIVGGKSRREIEESVALLSERLSELLT